MSNIGKRSYLEAAPIFVKILEGYKFANAEARKVRQIKKKLPSQSGKPPISDQNVKIFALLQTKKAQKPYS